MSRIHRAALGALTRILSLVLLSLCSACVMNSGQSVPAFHSDRLTVRVEGAGPDVLLIPGLGASPAIWNDARAAVPGYRYHVIHVAGFAGTSPSANGENSPFLPAIADEVARYIRERGLSPLPLIGHSMGGHLAMAIAARHPGLASKVMVVDMLPFAGLLIGGSGASSGDCSAGRGADQGDACQSRSSRSRTIGGRHDCGDGRKCDDAPTTGQKLPGERPALGGEGDG